MKLRYHVPFCGKNELVFKMEVLNVLLYHQQKGQQQGQYDILYFF